MRRTEYKEIPGIHRILIFMAAVLIAAVLTIISLGFYISIHKF